MAILPPWENPLCIPGLLLALILGVPMLGLNLICGLSLILSSSSSFSRWVDYSAQLQGIATFELFVVSGLIGILFLLPLLMILIRTKLKFYRFYLHPTQLRVMHWWLKYPFNLYRNFTQPLKTLDSITLQTDSQRISGGPPTSGYSPSPRTLRWAYLICRDMNGETLAMLELGYADPRLVRRLQKFMHILT